MVSLCLIRSVHSVFRLIEIFKILKFLREGVFVCFDWSMLIFNRSKLVNQVFQKDRIGLFQTSFSNSSFPFSLSTLALGSTIKFLSFSFEIFARFLSLEAGKTFLPFFLDLFALFFQVYFLISCIFHALSWVFSASSNFLGFLMIQDYSCVIDQWVFVS